MRQAGEAVHLLGDLITFTIKRADARTANLAIARLGERLERLVRDDLARRPVWGEVFADEVAYHASHIARACLESDDRENLRALIGLVERVAVALLNTGHGPAAYPLVEHLVHLGRELVRRRDGERVVAVIAAVSRTGRTTGEAPTAHLFEAAAAALGALGAAVAGIRFEWNPLAVGAEAAPDPHLSALEGLDALVAAGLERGLDEPVAASIGAVAAVGRALAEADGDGRSVGSAAAALRRIVERAAAAGRGRLVAAALDALADLAETGRRLDRPAVLEATLGALAAAGTLLEGVDLTLPGGAGRLPDRSAAAAAAHHLRVAGEGYEYLVARALRAAGDGPFRRRFQGGSPGDG